MGVECWARIVQFHIGVRKKFCHDYAQSSLCHVHSILHLHFHCLFQFLLVVFMYFCIAEQAKWYYYLLLGLVDVEANFLGESVLVYIFSS